MTMHVPDEAPCEDDLREMHRPRFRRGADGDGLVLYEPDEQGSGGVLNMGWVMTLARWVVETDDQGD